MKKLFNDFFKKEESTKALDCDIVGVKKIADENEHFSKVKSEIDEKSIEITSKLFEEVTNPKEKEETPRKLTDEELEKNFDWGNLVDTLKEMEDDELAKIGFTKAFKRVPLKKEFGVDLSLDNCNLTGANMDMNQVIRFLGK
ncbi:MAG: hypothetical protein ACK5LV_04370 [Lachnospirales bacterium]